MLTTLLHKISIDRLVKIGVCVAARLRQNCDIVLFTKKSRLRQTNKFNTIVPLRERARQFWDDGTTETLILLEQISGNADKTKTTVDQTREAQNEQGSIGRRYQT